MRGTRDDWRDLVTRQARSGLSVAEFCRLHELPQNSLYRWRRVLADDVESNSVPLAITGFRSVEIGLPCGAILKVSANRGTLSEVFAALLSIPHFLQTQENEMLSRLVALTSWCMTVFIMGSAALSQQPLINDEIEEAVVWADEMGLSNRLKGEFVQVSTECEIAGRSFSAVTFGVMSKMGLSEPIVVTMDLEHVVPISLENEASRHKLITTVSDTENLEKFARHVLEARSFPIESNILNYSRESGFIPSPVAISPARLTFSSRVFVLALVCSANDKPDLASELFELSWQLRDELIVGEYSFKQHLGVDFHRVLVDRLFEQLAADKIEWEEAHSRFRWIIASIDIDVIPDVNPLMERATRIETILEQMAIDELNRASSMDSNGQYSIESLITALRDQDSLGNNAKRTGFIAPFEQLKQHGNDALPDLIDAIGSEQFSRCIYESSGFGRHHELLTVGELAIELIEQITEQKVDFVYLRESEFPAEVAERKQLLRNAHLPTDR